MDINAALDSSDQDKRTVFVSGLDVITTEPELKEHFQVCGTIVRVTILRDRFTRMSKGCAYIQVQMSDILSFNSHSSSRQSTKDKLPTFLIIQKFTERR